MSGLDGLGWPNPEDEPRSPRPTQDEIDYLADQLIRHEKGFYHFLGIALSHANIPQAIRIREAFPEEWNQYFKKA